jgi:hypothetical protein
MTGITTIREYLSFLSTLGSLKQKTYYERMLRHGKAYQSAVESFDYDGYNTTPKACFHNSMIAAMEFDDFNYVEGYYICNGIPIAMEHAWNVSKKTGRTYDFTTVPNGIAVEERFGVVIPDKIMADFISSDLVGVMSPLQWCLRFDKAIFKKR